MCSSWPNYGELHTWVRFPAEMWYSSQFSSRELRGSFGVVQLLVQTERGQALAEHTHKVDRQTPATHTLVGMSRASVLADLLQRSCVGLTRTQAKVIKQLLHKFEDLFGVDVKQCTHTNLVQHLIDTGNTAPICQHARHLPLAKRMITEQQLQEMEASSVIELASSPWSSPVVLVRKKDKS